MIKLNIQRFGSTNKTTHYELSQFVSSDKPSWLNDINSDMSKIDTAINTAKTTADGAATAAGNAQTAAENAQGTANTAVTNAATADGKAETAQNRIGVLANLTTTVKTDLVDAINEVDANCDSNAAKIGSLSSLTTDVKTDIVSAVNSIETKIEELDNYSTSESLTGKKWINNKPIYRKVISGTVTTSGIDVNISNLDQYVEIKGTIRNVAGTLWSTLPYYRYNNPAYGVGFYISNGHITFDIDSSNPGSLNDPVIIILEYTKTTD